jgi:hypothetical protein
MIQYAVFLILATSLTAAAQTPLQKLGPIEIHPPASALTSITSVITAHGGTITPHTPTVLNYTSGLDAQQHLVMTITLTRNGKKIWSASIHGETLPTPFLISNVAQRLTELFMSKYSGYTTISIVGSASDDFVDTLRANGLHIVSNSDGAADFTLRYEVNSGTAVHDNYHQSCSSVGNYGSCRDNLGNSTTWGGTSRGSWSSTTVSDNLDTPVHYEGGYRGWMLYDSEMHPLLKKYYRKIKATEIIKVIAAVSSN